MRYSFHDTEISYLVKHAFHAIAIDEKRNPFVPSLWQRPKKPIYGQIVEQVWFPGVHSNIGGSYPDTDLADVSLRWMIARVYLHTKLCFSEKTSTIPLYCRKRLGSEHEPDSLDQLTQGSDLTIAMVTHSDEGSFWSVVKKGAEQAAKDEGVKLVWSPSNNDPEKEAQLIDAAVSQKVDGLAVSVPNADAIKGALAKATDAGIPIITLNSGADQFKELGAITHVGQDEAIAGQAAGERLKEEGAKKVLCVIHEQGNIGLNQRCDGVKQGFGGDGRPTSRSRAPRTSPTTQTEIKSKLQADKSYRRGDDAQPGHRHAAATAIKGAGSEAKLATFDLNPDVIKRIKDGTIAVRRRPAAVPAGLPADRLPEAVQDQRQHRRRRPARAHRPGLRRQEQRRRRSRSWRAKARDEHAGAGAPPEPAPVGRRAAGEHRPRRRASCAARRSARCSPRSSSRSSSGRRTRCSCSSTASRTGPTSARRSASRRWWSRC